MEQSTKSFAFKKKAKLANGTSVPALKPVEGPKEAMKAVMAITLNHTAEVLMAVVEAIADTYTLDKEEMMAAIVEHPAYKAVTLDPVLNDMGFLTETAHPTTVPKKKRFVIKKTAAAVEGETA
jgi:hypothetical protein